MEEEEEEEEESTGRCGCINLQARVPYQMIMLSSTEAILQSTPTRVNVVAPGIIDTEAFDRLGEGRSTALENMGKNIPIGRVGRAEEVGLAILHAMENPYMTGATIDIDGGILLP